LSAGTKGNVDKPGLTAEKELRSHFAGKRSARRKALKLKITICGIMENFPAESVDLSRSGILLQITDDLFAHAEEDLASFAFKVQQHFKKGADILFIDSGFGVSAHVVRVTHRKADGPALLLACRFRHALSDGQCQALGVDPRPDRHK
jgi:hypothetical protein